MEAILDFIIRFFFVIMGGILIGVSIKDFQKQFYICGGMELMCAIMCACMLIKHILIF